MAGVKRRIRKKAKKRKGRNWPKLVQMVKEIESYVGGDVSSPLRIVQSHVKRLLNRHFPSTPRPMTCESCFKYDFENIIAPKHLCGPHGKVDVIAIVTSTPSAREERKAIRQTWGSYTKYNNFRLVFLFGSVWPQKQEEALRVESEASNDILMDNFKDDYFNLTLKILMGYKWVLKECPMTKFIVRTADDCMLNVPRIFNLLNAFGNQEAFQKHQVGRCFVKAPPGRSIGNKGYLSTMDYPYDVFPPYAVGTVFITSKDLTQKMVRASENVPYLPIEDSYFGLVLAYIGRGCHHIEGMQSIYAVHSVPPKSMVLHMITWRDGGRATTKHRKKKQDGAHLYT